MEKALLQTSRMITCQHTIGTVDFTTRGQVGLLGCCARPKARRCCLVCRSRESTCPSASRPPPLVPRTPTSSSWRRASPATPGTATTPVRRALRSCVRKNSNGASGLALCPNTKEVWIFKKEGDGWVIEHTMAEVGLRERRRPPAAASDASAARPGRHRHRLGPQDQPHRHLRPGP